ncbi:hypothetical protein C7974DRAFT_323017 [Boeremia exigua]|uniref:uncharacterized protein n=1 Tax=Boeremia exigua TaxID=749465 RepID=UPI001E8DC838|nr:uncharacterized protein C7974DRAFT_323017 [Boeremia exigua]KAH6612490.1 hypothetical protein C7974DRAFT_323017 [Boeremia exigua]
MTSQSFDAQLLIPDNNASHRQLVELIAAGEFTGRGLPDVAHKYLDAFCNNSYSNGRRRWAGVALVGMMRASASVVQRLKKLSRGPSRLGAIVLNHRETEERRIIAGLIIRQGLDAGIDFADFWDSSKIMDSVLNFPKDSNEEWMAQFQRYLDTLSGLAFANLSTDAVVLYPMFLSANDDFQWTGRSAVALIEENALKMFVSDSTLTEFQFVDIPLGHIKEINLQHDSPHESQEGRSGHKMYSATIVLHHSSPNYYLNASSRTTSEFRLAFSEQDDANEFYAGLQSFVTASNAAAETDEPKTSRVPHKNLREQSASRSEPRDSGDTNSVTSSAETLDEPALSEHPPGSGKERGKGKLKSISKATKQKAVRTQRLPSGPSKVTKSRAAKRAAPIIDVSGDEDESEDSSQDEYHPKSTARARNSLSSGTVRKSQGRRRMNAEDEAFVPTVSKAKPMSTKRKRASSDADEHNRPTKKKTDMRSGTDTIQNGGPGRHSLIDGLLNSKSPNKAAAPTFKKPGQPASTPRRPKTQSVRTTPRPQTPHDAEDLPVYISSSSTPRSQVIHEEDFGLGHTPIDAEILSSNTKRVPDSPHAESTAISGHADRDDVQREKRIADMETAKSDPFQQRGQGQKITTFTRKLTGEGFVDDGAVHKESFNDDLEADELPIDIASQPLPKHIQPKESIISAPQEAVEDTLPQAIDQQPDAANVDGETTLVGEEMDLPEQYTAKASDLRFRSSPPIPDSSSVRDASSDAPEPEPEQSPATSRADELEWEDSLQPHQRDLHEQLLRTSKRVVRNIVGHETAVTDIADVFANDGERLLNLLLERQESESTEAFQELMTKKQSLLKELSDTSKNLKLQRKQLKDIE